MAQPCATSRRMTARSVLIVALTILDGAVWGAQAVAADSHSRGNRMMRRGDGKEENAAVTSPQDEAAAEPPENASEAGAPATRAHAEKGADGEAESRAHADGSTENRSALLVRRGRKSSSQRSLVVSSTGELEPAFQEPVSSTGPGRREAVTIDASGAPLLVEQVPAAIPAPVSPAAAPAAKVAPVAAAPVGAPTAPAVGAASATAAPGVAGAAQAPAASTTQALPGAETTNTTATGGASPTGTLSGIISLAVSAIVLVALCVGMVLFCRHHQNAQSSTAQAGQAAEQTEAAPRRSYKRSTLEAHRNQRSAVGESDLSDKSQLTPSGSPPPGHRSSTYRDRRLGSGSKAVESRPTPPTGNGSSEASVPAQAVPESASPAAPPTSVTAAEPQAPAARTSSYRSRRGAAGDESSSAPEGGAAPQPVNTESDGGTGGAKPARSSYRNRRNVDPQESGPPKDGGVANDAVPSTTKADEQVQQVQEEDAMF